MTPTDYCFVVKSVGAVSCQRALEVFEWLNLRHWHSPNARMMRAYCKKLRVSSRSWSLKASSLMRLLIILCSMLLLERGIRRR
ncbi:unnamed protein product [Brassica oleracea]|uniref:Uncharacterized protein n=1 Tax=Brassica oleracea TaxID=3712 RepID=A0A3P6EMU3_BRAOL|nr:unnamed protein product [Brassica oleracea]